MRRCVSCLCLAILAARGDDSGGGDVFDWPDHTFLTFQSSVAQSFAATKDEETIVAANVDFRTVDLNVSGGHVARLNMEYHASQARSDYEIADECMSGFERIFSVSECSAAAAATNFAGGSRVEIGGHNAGRAAGCVATDDGKLLLHVGPNDESFGCEGCDFLCKAAAAEVSWRFATEISENENFTTCNWTYPPRAPLALARDSLSIGTGRRRGAAHSVMREATCINEVGDYGSDTCLRRGECAPNETNDILGIEVCRPILHKKGAQCTVQTDVPGSPGVASLQACLNLVEQHCDTPDYFNWQAAASREDGQNSCSCVADGCAAMLVHESVEDINVYKRNCKVCKVVLFREGQYCANRAHVPDSPGVNFTLDECLNAVHVNCDYHLYFNFDPTTGSCSCVTDNCASARRSSRLDAAEAFTNIYKWTDDCEAVQPDEEMVLRFRRPPGLAIGDKIQVGGRNVICSPNSTCTQEMLTLLTTSPWGSPPWYWEPIETYFSSHKVLWAWESRVKIRVEWPAPSPRFEINMTEGRGGNWSLRCRLDGQERFRATAADVTFMHGGRYQLCYASAGQPSGDMQGLLAPMSVMVYGVKSPCTYKGCLALERWHCSFVYKGETFPACKFDFTSDGASSVVQIGWNLMHSEDPLSSKMTWSQTWPEDDAENGRLVAMSPIPCGTSPATSKFNMSIYRSYPIMTLTQTSVASMPPVSQFGRQAFTMSACYCPAYNSATESTCDATNARRCCDDYPEFIQQFGIIYMWTMKICDASTWRACDTQYMRVVPQQKFTLVVDCPPGGACLSGRSNRLKFVEPRAGSEVPSWDADYVCRQEESSAVVWQKGICHKEAAKFMDFNAINQTATGLLYRSSGPKSTYDVTEDDATIFQGIQMSEYTADGLVGVTFDTDVRLVSGETIPNGTKVKYLQGCGPGASETLRLPSTGTRARFVDGVVNCTAIMTDALDRNWAWSAQYLRHPAHQLRGVSFQVLQGDAIVSLTRARRSDGPLNGQTDFAFRSTANAWEITEMGTTIEEGSGRDVRKIFVNSEGLVFFYVGDELKYTSVLSAEWPLRVSVQTAYFTTRVTATWLPACYEEEPCGSVAAGYHRKASPEMRKRCKEEDNFIVEERAASTVEAATRCTAIDGCTAFAFVSSGPHAMYFRVCELQEDPQPVMDIFEVCDASIPCPADEPVVFSDMQNIQVEGTLLARRDGARETYAIRSRDAQALGDAITGNQNWPLAVLGAPVRLTASPRFTIPSGTILTGFANCVNGTIVATSMAKFLDGVDKCNTLLTNSLDTNWAWSQESIFDPQRQLRGVAFKVNSGEAVISLAVPSRAGASPSSVGDSEFAVTSGTFEWQIHGAWDNEAMSNTIVLRGEGSAEKSIQLDSKGRIAFYYGEDLLYTSRREIDWSDVYGLRVGVQTAEPNTEIVTRLLFVCGHTETTLTSVGSLDGGSRVDYKAWPGRQPLLNLRTDKALDVCYCNSDPDAPESWIRVGQVKTTRALAFANSTGLESALRTVQYVGVPGSLTLYGGVTSTEFGIVDPYDANMYSGKALISPISYDRQLALGESANETLASFYGFDVSTPSDFDDLMDDECRKQHNPSTLLAVAASGGHRHYMGQIGSRENEAGQYMTFTDAKNMTFRQAGVIALCYCAIVNWRDECESPNYWMFIGRMTIGGPLGTQQWTFPFDIAVKLQLRGWGFRDGDKLRVIPSNSSCEDNAMDPAAETLVRVNCYRNSRQSCKSDTRHEIPANALTSSSTRAGIESVVTSATQSTLLFNASLENMLHNGDIISLVFDRSRFLVNGRNESFMTSADRFEAMKLIGRRDFRDYASGVAANSSASYLVGHRVAFMESGGVTNYSMVNIPVGWTDAPNFTFVGQQLGWMRSNVLDTEEEVKALQPLENLKVCWAPLDVDAYQPAGKITFEDSARMLASGVHLTTTQEGAVAPFVISFETSPQQHEYASMKGKTQLLLRFRDDRSLSLRLARDRPPSLAASPPADVQQATCGALFLEVWSGHSEGFPMPVGCYYNGMARDQLVDGDYSAYYRELYIVFGEENGIRSGQRYQLVMNGVLRGVASGEEVVDIFSMCHEDAGCPSPYNVFERSTAVASKASQPKATGSDPQMRKFVVDNVNSYDYLDLAAVSSFQVTLAGGPNEATSIPARSIVRLFLWPLMQWDLDTGVCSATWIGGGSAAGAQLRCNADEVVLGSDHRNVAHLVLPTDLVPITLTDRQSFDLAGITPAASGYFPSRIGAQLTGPDDSAPYYVLSSGMLMASPAADQSAGQLVLTGRTGYGPRPFVRDEQNIIVMRLQFLATARNAGGEGGAAITIELPPGYKCYLPDATSDDAVNMTRIYNTDRLFAVDADRDGFPDHNRGLLSVSKADGMWANISDNFCRYVMKVHMAVFAGQVVYVRFVVDNPSQALNIDDPANQWNVHLASTGTEVEAVLPEDVFPPAPLRSSSSLVFASNIGVITALARENLQPRGFVRSSPVAVRPTSEFVRVFIRTTRASGARGGLVIDAPDGFDFARRCHVRDLDAAYYREMWHSPQLRPLDQVAGCTGRKYPIPSRTYNSAEISLRGELGLDSIEVDYGFEILVQYPSYYSDSQHIEWYVWTRNAGGHTMEGSYQTLRFNPRQTTAEPEFHQMSWGMYNGDANHVSLTISRMRPYSMTLQFARLYVWNIAFPKSTNTSLRVTAPDGFTFNPNVSHTFQGFLSVLDDPGALTAGVGYFPVPVVENGNQLVWRSLPFVADLQYSFAAEVKVPDNSPVISSNCFFIEFGFHETSIQRRLMASVIEYTTTTTSLPIPFGTGVRTATTEMANAGDTALEVESTEGFYLWDQVLIGGIEQIELSGFGSLLLSTGLEYSYPPGVEVERLPRGWALYRFTWLKLREVHPVERVHLGEVLLRYRGSRVDMSRATAHVQEGASLPGEGPEKAIDGDSRTKWLDLGGGPLLINFPEAVMIDSYSFFTAGDTPSSDPVRWRLEGSNDAGKSFDILNELHVDAPAPQDRNSLYLEWFRVPPCYGVTGFNRLQQCIDTRTLISRGLASAESPL